MRLAGHDPLAGPSDPAQHHAAEARFLGRAREQSPRIGHRLRRRRDDQQAGDDRARGGEPGHPRRRRGGRLLAGPRRARWPRGPREVGPQEQPHGPGEIEGQQVEEEARRVEHQRQHQIAEPEMDDDTESAWTPPQAHDQAGHGERPEPHRHQAVGVLDPAGGEVAPDMEREGRRVVAHDVQERVEHVAGLDPEVVPAAPLPVHLVGHVDVVLVLHRVAGLDREERRPRAHHQRHPRRVGERMARPPAAPVGEQRERRRRDQEPGVVAGQERAAGEQPGDGPRARPAAPQRQPRGAQGERQRRHVRSRLDRGRDEDRVGHQRQDHAQADQAAQDAADQQERGEGRGPGGHDVEQPGAEERIAPRDPRGAGEQQRIAGAAELEPIGLQVAREQCPRRRERVAEQIGLDPVEGRAVRQQRQREPGQGGGDHDRHGEAIDAARRRDHPAQVLPLHLPPEDAGDGADLAHQRVELLRVE